MFRLWVELQKQGTFINFTDLQETNLQNIKMQGGCLSFHTHNTFYHVFPIFKPYFPTKRILLANMSTDKLVII